ncbi:MAG: PspC domain-containing protein [Acidobacteriaceae bacterium]|nr:PspC domain-containing protein [Acidobacteriaceae bacterium]
MYCSACGVQMPDEFRFCSSCGAPAGSAAGRTAGPQLPLRRSRADKKIAGVCAGLAQYLNVDVTLMRVLVLCAAIWGGVGLIFYIICWIVMPQEPLLLPPPAPSSPQPAANPVRL